MEKATLRTYEDEINEIVSDLFGTMLNTEATPSAQRMAAGASTLTSIIAFAGSWKGDLVLECGRPQALVFAKRFLQCEDLDENSEDVVSTVAELSNIIAGNLKVVLPPGVTISTPSVIQGGNYDIQIYGGKIINHTVYDTDAGSFDIRLIEASSVSKGA